MPKRFPATLALPAFLITLTAVSPAMAQQRQAQSLFLPNVSPRAEIAQTLGVAEIRIYYHRPAVNGRDIFGALVPLGQVWRTGANETTLISFSHDVKIEGQDLAAGTYGLHTLPGEDEWTVIFNNDTESWGSFNYDQAQDALRVTVKPAVAERCERFEISFDDPDNSSTTVSMHWAETRAAFKVEVDSHAHTMASIHSQLKGLSSFGWQGWNQAAGYTNFVDQDLEQGLQWAELSINIQPNFNNYNTKAQILTKLGRADEADEVLAAALPLGNAGQLHNYGRQLLAQGQTEKALEVFKRNGEQNPDAWFIGVGLARGHSALGQFTEAAAGMRMAIGKAPETQQAYLQGLLDQLEAGTDIN